ncbi:hypothetical protein WJX72_008872 [[Myrmecia] bisecta]|uniref:Uncharacterized protein n=1 Tax=[Myrmecia] bisecta TaxID=41462 RepID=A0AAW1R8T9_9CHLO
MEQEQEQDCEVPTYIAAIRTADLFIQLKSGDARQSVGIASELVASGRPLEVQHTGYALLQHLVGVRWDDFSDQERSQLAVLSFNLVRQVGGAGDGWPVRSKAALVLALVAKRQGPELWQAMLPQLLALEKEGPLMAEVVCMVLRFMTEEITQYADDLNADAKRLLLSSLMASLDVVLPFLQQVLEQHFGQALAASQQGGQEQAAKHVGAVNAALASVAAYVEWAPLGRILASRLLDACAFFLTTAEFRLPAVDILRQITSRKQLQEELTTFNQVNGAIGEALMRAAAAVLEPAMQRELDYEGSLEEFGQRLCDTMVAFGSGHLHTLASPEKKILFLQQMIGFTQHRYMVLAAKALPLWISLLSANSSLNSLPVPPEHLSVPMDCVAALMDSAGEQLRYGVHLAEEGDDFPAWADSAADYKNQCVAYRTNLSRIVKLTAGVLPEPALAAASRRMQTALSVCSTTGTGAALEEQQSQFEVAVFFTESVLTIISDVHFKRQGAALQAVLASMEGILQQLLAARMQDATLVTLWARVMEAFGKFTALRPAAAPLIIQKVFAMIASVPLETEPGGVPPAKPPPGWKDRFAARQKVTTVLVTHAKESPQAMAPHLQALGAKIEEELQAGRIIPAERDVMSDAFVAVAAAGDASLQVQVTEWALASVRAQWVSPAWQQNLATPNAFVSYHIPLQQDAQGAVELTGGEHRWALYHQAHLVEKVTKRLPSSAAQPKGATANGGSTGWHALTAHLDWILPSLLQICRCIHALWTPQMRARLQPINSAFEMGPKERAVYLKQPLGKNVPTGEEEAETVADSNPAGLRAWLRQLRESVYQTLGWMVAHVGGFYACSTGQAMWGISLTENLEVMDYQTIRLLHRHLLISLVKLGPPDQRQAWLLPVLGPLIPHMLRQLSSAWSALLAATAPAALASAPGGTSEDASSANAEVVEERLIRELTQEHLLLLLQLQDSGGQTGKGSPTVLDWLFQASPDTAFSAVALAASALWWPDEGVVRATTFCRAVVNIASKDQRLHAFVGREMLRGAITALGWQNAAPHQSEVLHLARDILAQQLATSPGPREVLLSLPRIDASTLADFEAAFSKLNSEKEQRLLVKKLLQRCGAEGLATALAADFRQVVKVAGLAEPKARPAKHASFHDQMGSSGFDALTGSL